jgi:hypothetical protein
MIDSKSGRMMDYLNECGKLVCWIMIMKKILDAIIFERPFPEDGILNICMDKGYDYPDIRQLVKDYGYTANIKEPGRRKHKKRDARF